jgi:hypothetical protein
MELQSQRGVLETAADAVGRFLLLPVVEFVQVDNVFLVVLVELLAELCDVLFVLRMKLFGTSVFGGKLSVLAPRPVDSLTSCSGTTST